MLYLSGLQSCCLCKADPNLSLMRTLGYWDTARELTRFWNRDTVSNKWHNNYVILYIVQGEVP